jgi:hypothetical protein
MPSINSLISKLQHDHPEFQFQAGDLFQWSPTESSISYDPTSNDPASLLHELAHGILGHANYTKDIELIDMERAAWEYTKQTLGPTYGITIMDDVIQGSLDTYRDWLHARSTCPHCQATGIQSKKYEYKCLVCSTQWRVNDARICALRRYTL